MNSEEGVPMEVTADKFTAALPLVEDALAGCDFFAFDCEFTGLFATDGQAHYLDEMQDRYRQVLDSSLNFLVTQFGLSCFTRRGAGEGGGYVARTFNFYVFPQPFEGFDRRFLSQASSLSFLASQGFDFNKFISQGIPCMPLYMRDQRLAQLEREVPRDSIVISSAADIAFVEALKAEVTEWLAGDEASLDLKAVNGYLRAVQYQQLRLPQFGLEGKHPGFFVERVNQDGDRRVFLRLVRASAAEAAAAEAAARAARRQAIVDAAGFSHIWELLRRSGKPSVGHNLQMDLSYCLNSFVQPLPHTWEQYKEVVQRWLPGGVYDTKYLAALLARDIPYFSTSLGDLYTGLQEDQGGAVLKELLAAMQAGGVSVPQGFALPPCEHAPGHLRYQGASVEQYSHEAGYDAFMTGCVFAAMLQLHALVAGDAAAGLAAVGQYEGRLNISKSDLPYASLFAPDPVPDRSHVLVLLGVQPGTRGQQLAALLAPAKLGPLRCSVLATHAFAEVVDPGSVAGAAAAVKALRPQLPYKVLTYAEWRDLRNGVSVMDADEVEEDSGVEARERPNKRRRNGS